MQTAMKQMEAALLQEHKSVWAFCGSLEVDSENSYEAEVKASHMMSQALRDWARYREFARKEYEAVIKSAQDAIKNIDNNQSIYFGINADRVAEYNAKADTQVEMARTAAYIIGLSNEKLGDLFAIITALQFKKEMAQ